MQTNDWRKGGIVHKVRCVTPEWGRGYNSLEFSSVAEEVFHYMFYATGQRSARADLLIDDLYEEEEVNYREPHNPGFTLLHMACYVGRYDYAELLLFRGAKITATSQGDSPLSLAVKQTHNIDLMELLMAYPVHDPKLLDGKMGDLVALHKKNLHGLGEDPRIIKLLKDYKNNPKNEMVRIRTKLGMPLDHVAIYAQVLMLTRGYFEIKK